MNKSNYFHDNGDGTVTDLKTNFTWQKCSMGQKEDSFCTGTAVSVNWLIAVRYCEKLMLANKSWTLPTSEEFITLISDQNNDQPDLMIFPNNNAGYYWSSTSHEIISLVGIVVNTQARRADYKVKFDTNSVRCIVKHKHKKSKVHHQHENWKEDD